MTDDVAKQTWAYEDYAEMALVHVHGRQHQHQHQQLCSVQRELAQQHALELLDADVLQTLGRAVEQEEEEEGEEFLDEAL